MKNLSLIALVIFTLAACGGGDSGTTSDPDKGTKPVFVNARSISVGEAARNTGGSAASVVVKEKDLYLDEDIMVYKHDGANFSAASVALLRDNSFDGDYEIEITADANDYIDASSDGTKNYLVDEAAKTVSLGKGLKAGLYKLVVDSTNNYLIDIGPTLYFDSTYDSNDENNALGLGQSWDIPLTSNRNHQIKTYMRGAPFAAFSASPDNFNFPSTRTNVKLIAASGIPIIIKLKVGTYSASPNDNTGSAFLVANNMRIYGGFDGTEGTNDIANGGSLDFIKANANNPSKITILSAITADKQHTYKHTINTKISSTDTRNTYYPADKQSSPLISGVKISDGSADGNADDNKDKGAAIYLENGYLTLYNVLISGNKGADQDSPIIYKGSDATLDATNVEIQGNTPDQQLPN